MIRNKNLIAYILVIMMMMCFPFTGCGPVTEETPWEQAIYTEDTAFGTGAKTVSVEVQVENNTVNFTVHTDKEMLDEALIEHNLISGEQGPYGLYVKTVNGITADYDINQSYWSFCQNQEPLQSGVSGVEIFGGEQYQFIYTK